MDDEDILPSDKFEDCETCKHKFCEWICDDECDVGESYEPEDIEEVDAHFQGRY
jgi:hypothetical protein